MISKVDLRHLVRLFLGTSLLALALARPAVAAEDAATTRPDLAFKVLVRESGVYELTYEDLHKAATNEDATAVPLSELPTDALTMTVDGNAVPLWIDDGGDGRFGPGDRLEWIGERRHGDDGTYFHPHSPHNVYRLSSEGGGLRMQSAATPPPGPVRRQWRILEVSDHLEEDLLMLRFGKRQSVTTAEDGSTRLRDTWHWAKLTHLDPRPFRLPLDLSTYDPESDEPLRLRLELSGWSRPVPRREGVPDHQVDVLLNGTPLGSGTWDGQDIYELAFERLDPALIKKGINVLEIDVPKRFPVEDGDPLIDVVLLNWLQLDYPRRHVLRVEEERFSLHNARTDRWLTFTTEPGQRFTFYGNEGWRLPPEAQRIVDNESKTLLSWMPPSPVADTAQEDVTPQEVTDTVYAVQQGALSSPEEILVDRPSDLRNPQRQADYLMITHPRLRHAIEPLAELHRQRGLHVAVVDVDDIYDEFNHGIVDPNAIRDFVALAYHQWQSPRPRFVLLVGDASWDIKNEDPDDTHYADWTYRPGEKRRFSKNTSFAYDGQTTAPRLRNLIPAWSYASYQGHAASDNGYVTVDGDDFDPDLAIGRLPVTEPAEVSAIVKKIRQYVLTSPVGPWRRDVLWITNDMKAFQNRSHRLAGELAKGGFSATEIFPSPDEKDNLQHQADLRQAFDTGQLLVHFYGHGGRYIWRTGPPDLKKNHDLFTLDDLDLLAPSERLPLVLSMSCYSAPFDHPTADSIGEKFLRLADRGAVAVLAASWRNSPSVRFSRRLLDELTQRQPIGEAIRRAKIDSGSEVMVALYNLLGDPALELALPSHQLTLEAEPSGQLSVDLAAAELTKGRAMVTWLTATGEVVEQQELVVDGPRLQVPVSEDSASRQVQVYAWDAEQGRDALGTLKLPPDPSKAAKTAAGASK